MSYAFIIIGFALCFYGLSPLSGSRPLDGFLSEQGCLACVLGIALLTIIGCVKVMA